MNLLISLRAPGKVSETAVKMFCFASLNYVKAPKHFRLLFTEVFALAHVQE